MTADNMTADTDIEMNNNMALTLEPDKDQHDFTLDYIFENLTQLPTFPKAVQKAMELLNNPNTTTKHLVDVLKFDPAITTNVLRLTNSARFGLAQKVTNLETALSLLGRNQLKEILMASGSIPYISRELYGYCMRPEDLWHHSMATAICADILSKYINFEEPTTLFTAALLHDIGKIVLNLYVGGNLEKILELATKEGYSFTEAEWMVLGGDHAVIGSEIMNQWDFPEDIIKAIRNHHDPDLYIQDRLSSMLALSNILVIIMGIGVGADGFRYWINPELLDALKITRNDIYEVMFETYKEFINSKDALMLYKDNN